jgi:anti-anti-sigma factor
MSLNLQVIHPTGILDSTQTNQLRNEVNAVIDAGTKVILVDLKDVSFMDSSGLGVLVTALKTVRSAGGKLCVCSLNEQIKILFELTSMDRVFEIFTDQHEFLQAIKDQPST